MNETALSVSVVVPVYNSAPTLEALAARLTPVLEGLGVPYEVILVDDGSTDASWDELERLTRSRPKFRAISFQRNYGQHNALLAGTRLAAHSVVVTLDDDLQNPPEEIPSLLVKLAEGHDLVYGRPRAEQHGLWRNIASRLTKLALSKAASADVARQVSAFRVFRTSLRDAFSRFDSPFVSIDVLLTWSTTRVSSMIVRHDPRAAGHSNYTVSKLLRHALNMLTGFTVGPLRLATLTGFAFTLFGGIVLAIVLGAYVFGSRHVAGFAFLASIITLFAGAQLFCLGVIGEYLARVHFRVMDRPTYVVGRRSEPASMRASHDR